MREILFRGKRKDNGEWVYGAFVNARDVIDDQQKSYIIWEAEYFSHGEFACVEEVIPESVGQYTGLCDKNGNKIFEGDIHCHKERYYVVRFGKHSDTFYSGDRFGWYLEEINGERVESFDGFEYLFVNIIGNIYDNKNILEE